MTLENLESLVVTIGLGAFSGYIIGYAIRKVLKIVFVVLGIFFAGIAYLQLQGILDVKWDKVQSISTEVVMAVGDSYVFTNAFALNNLYLPLSSSMITGFIFGFLRG